ncbi:MAG: outer membrane protein transport protein [Candidatus Marinimicrobia bacterium]|nr:outer membrane protein transport protein [Candidatus Neomarinimicrobiota bacterium]MCF7828921.1 outer membrane protein transport protein [Candidatus Neomarinimicrobiota bacterium]MCF7879881.1 outer membrane protein transport protein [Candidatus Neomarinimicrobiota bacterium]
MGNSCPHFVKTFIVGFSGIVILLFLTVTTGFSQHRGDEIAFQGLANSADYSVKPLAMGNAYNASSGEIQSLYFNPAGLANLEKMQFSISGSASRKHWRENQEYRPNRLFVTLPFYLEGLYTPSSLNVDSITGEPVLDEDIAIDSNYVVNDPELGLDPYSRDAADWMNDREYTGLNSAALAYPFRVMDRNIVIAVGYKNRYNVSDFDRNDTYLDPHIGYSDYNMPGRLVEGDTVHLDWFRYLRERSGQIHEVKGGLGAAISEKLNLGIRVTSLFGETDDTNLMEKVGYFELIEENSFLFGFDSIQTVTTGHSAFSANSIDIGGIYAFRNVTVGLNIGLPYSVRRDWNYTIETTDSAGVITEESKGTDTFHVPATYTLGLKFTPTNRFTFSLDFVRADYSKAEFDFSDPGTDSTHHHWVDQTVVRSGIEFKATDNLSLLGGYQYVPQVFVPDGNAFNDTGPAAQVYSVGASYSVFDIGRIDLAYQIQNLRYYDQYMSNTNYNVVTRTNFSVEYTHLF